jgi:hypothetical protein
MSWLVNHSHQLAPKGGAALTALAARSFIKSPLGIGLYLLAKKKPLCGGSGENLE